MISKKNSFLINIFLNQKVRLIIHKQTRILLFHLKNMKYSAALPMFLIWRLHVERKLLSFDKMRFFLFVCLFVFFARSRLKDVSFHEKNIHKILAPEFV